MVCWPVSEKEANRRGFEGSGFEDSRIGQEEPVKKNRSRRGD